MGTFTVGETKIRPGVYNRYENAGGSSIAGALQGIVAGLIRANWGPLNTVVTLDPSSDVNKIFGAGTGMTQNLITEMFKAAITKGYFVRIGSGGTAATIALKDSAATSVVTITAKYVGSRAFTISVRDSLANTTKRECIIYDGTTEFEKVEFAKGTTEVDAIVAAFANSTNFTASKTAAGSGTLANTTQTAFTVGTNPTATTAEYSAGLTLLEACKFNAMAVDTDDTATHALVAAFVSRIYVAGAYPMAVLAEKKSVAIATRMADAAAFNDAKICYVLNAAADTAGNDIDGYILAARIAGIIAATPSNQSVTHTAVSGFASVAEPLTNTQIEAALKSGCIVLTTNASGQVWIEQGINTLITPSGNQDEGWKKIRRVKTRFELMQRVGETIETLIGKVNNDTDGRAAVVASGQSVINAMIAEKKLLAGSSMTEDVQNPAVGDSAWFIIAVDDIDSIEKVYLTYRFRFTAEA